MCSIIELSRLRLGGLGRRHVVLVSDNTNSYRRVRTWVTLQGQPSSGSLLLNHQT